MEKLTNIWHWIKSALEFELIEVGGHSISIYNIVVLVFILLFVRIVVKLIERLIRSRLASKKWITQGKEHAFVQLSKYILYLIGFVLALEAVGLDTTTIIIGSSALFVGLGFGLQEAFRDFISGLILLFEGDVIIGDVIELENGTVAVVKKINIRTSKIRTRDGIILIVPNSQLINDRVINWSNSNKLTRFHVSVGVAYGSNVELVEELLLESVRDMDAVSSRLKPFVRFVDFGNSSLDFEIHFWTEEVWRIEDIRSQMRFTIDQKFRAQNITIPFPQRDLHFKSSDVNFKPDEA